MSIFTSFLSRLTRLRADPESFDSCRWSCEASEHEADHCEADEGSSLSKMPLEVAREASAAADPGKRALDDPALGQHLEARNVRPLDDLDEPRTGARQAVGEARALVAAVGEDAFDEGEEAPRARVEHERGAVAILDVCRMHDDVQEEAEGVDKNVPLAARDLLARIVARWVERRAPFCAPLTLWLSMIAAVGLAARPSWSRTAT